MQEAISEWANTHSVDLPLSHKLVQPVILDAAAAVSYREGGVNARAVLSPRVNTYPAVHVALLIRTLLENYKFRALSSSRQKWIKCPPHYLGHH